MEDLILKAIQLCNQDIHLNIVKYHLNLALNEFKIQEKKNIKKNKMATKEKERLKTEQQKWWEMIKKNSLDNFKIDLENNDNLW